MPVSVVTSLIYIEKKKDQIENSAQRRFLRHKKEDVMRVLIKLYKEKLHNLYSSPCFIIFIYIYIFLTLLLAIRIT
jgi:hypothetical protein